MGSDTHVTATVSEASGAPGFGTPLAWPILLPFQFGGGRCLYVAMNPE